MAGWLLPRSRGRLGLGARAPLSPWHFVTPGHTYKRYVEKPWFPSSKIVDKLIYSTCIGEISRSNCYPRPFVETLGSLPKGDLALGPLGSKETLISHLDCNILHTIISLIATLNTDMEASNYHVSILSIGP